MKFIESLMKELGIDIDTIRRQAFEKIRPDFEARKKTFGDLTNVVANGLLEDDDTLQGTLHILKVLHQSDLDRENAMILLAVAITEHARLRKETGNVAPMSETERDYPESTDEDSTVEGHNCGCDFHAAGKECSNCGPVAECSPVDLPKVVDDLMTRLGFERIN